MKKTYIHPQLKTVQIAVRQLLSGSTFDMNRKYRSGEGITLGGRDYDLEDDDDEY